MNKKVMSLIAAFSVTIIIIIVLIVATVSGNDSQDNKNNDIQSENNNIENKDKVEEEVDKEESPEKKDVNDENSDTETKKQNTVTYKNTLETTEIDFKTITIEDNNSKIGKNKVLREGKKGTKTVLKLVTITDGKETDSKVIKEYISKEPVDKIISKGTHKGPMVLTKNETLTESIEFKTITKEDPTIPLGEKVVQTKGIYGEKKITFKVTYEDGLESNRELIKETITIEPVDKVILVGTKSNDYSDDNLGNSNKIFENEILAKDWAQDKIIDESSEWYDHNYSIIKIKRFDGTFKYSIEFSEKN